MTAGATGVRPPAARAPRTPPRRRPRRGGDAPVALGAALLGALLVLLTRQGLVDDAYITLSYARSLVEDGTWGMVPGLTANTATSPLNVLLLAGATLLTEAVGPARPVVGLALVTTLASGLMGWAASALARGLGASRAWGLAVVAVVLANPFLNSSVGLEVVPVAAAALGLAALAAAARPAAFGAVAGLAVLTRADLALVAAAVWLAAPAVRRALLRVVAAGAAVCLPWLATSWWFLGSALPATLAIKTLQRSFGGITYTDGLWELWYPRSPAGVLLGAVPAVVGVLALVPVAVAAVRRRARPAGPALAALAGLGAGGVAHAVAYCLLGVPPYQWYYVPATAALGASGVLALGAAAGRAPRPVQRTAALASGAAAAVALLWPVAGSVRPWEHPPLYGNWAEPAEYLAAGRDIGRLVGDAPVLAPPEIGTIAFACDCTVLDQFSDPGRTLPLIEESQAEASPWLRPLLRLDTARLDRDRLPVHPQYRIEWTDEQPPPGVPAWATDAPARGPGWLVLLPAGDAHTGQDPAG